MGGTGTALQNSDGEGSAGCGWEGGRPGGRPAKTLPGWKCDIRGIRKFEELPENCRNYVEFVEKEIGFPITLVSNGPGREDIIVRGYAG